MGTPKPNRPNRAEKTTVLVLDAAAYGGAVVRRDGREIPITDDMVLRACRALEQQRFPFRQLPQNSLGLQLYSL